MTKKIITTVVVVAMSLSSVYLSAQITREFEKERIPCGNFEAQIEVAIWYRGTIPFTASVRHCNGALTKIQYLDTNVKLASCGEMTMPIVNGYGYQIVSKEDLRVEFMDITTGEVVINKDVPATPGRPLRNILTIGEDPRDPNQGYAIDYSGLNAGVYFVIWYDTNEEIVFVDKIRHNLCYPDW